VKSGQYLSATVKVGALFIYVAALLSLFLDLPPRPAQMFQYIALTLLVLHAAEVPLCWRWVRMYDGPVLLSALYTLLFGLVHWLPYALRVVEVQRSRNCR
jgi:hypothetical protein